jgi:hypothetical protein
MDSVEYRGVVLGNGACAPCENIIALSYFDCLEACEHLLDFLEARMWAFCAAARDWIVRLMCDGALGNRAETAVAVAVLAAWHIAKILGPFKAIDARRRDPCCTLSVDGPEVKTQDSLIVYGFTMKRIG